MCEKFENIKDKVIGVMAENFSGYHFDFMEDPEDESVIYINLYDVDDCDVGNFKRFIRSELRDKFRDDVLLVPSIISHEDTKMCYAQYLRKPRPVIVIDEPEAHLKEDIAKRIQLLLSGECETRKMTFDIDNWIGDRMIMSTFQSMKGFEHGEYGISQNLAA